MRRPAAVVNWFWFVQLAAVLGGIVPVVLIYVTDSAPGSGVSTFSVWPWALVVTVWAGARLAWQISSGRSQLYQFSAWMFIYVFGGLAPLCQLREGAFPSTVPGIDPQSVTTGYAIVIVAVIAYEFGTALSTVRASAAPAVKDPRRELSLKRTTWLAIFGLVFAAYYAQKIGIGTLFESRQARDVTTTATWSNPTSAAIYGGLAFGPSLASVHAFTNLRRKARKAGDRPERGFLLVLCVVALLVIVNPVSSPRITFGTVALSLLYVAGAFITPRRAALAMTGVLLALIVVFPYADYFRTSSGGFKSGGVSYNFVNSGDYDAYGMTVNTVEYVKAHGYSNGSQLAGAALFFVPRSVWPGKPDDTSKVVATWKGYVFTNLSEPLWAEFYINGSWPLVVIGFAWLGYATGRAGRRIIRSDTVGGVAAGIVPFYLIILLRGSLLAAMSTLAVIVVCIWLTSAPHAREPAPKPSKGVKATASS